jgi:hypothetical protein
VYVLIAREAHTKHKAWGVEPPCYGRQDRGKERKGARG